MTTKIASLGIPGDVIMSAGAGLDFSAASKGVFKGLEAVIWRMVNSESAGAQDPLGAGGADWELADDLETENYLGAVGLVTESSGIFSFGSTGYWLTMLVATGSNGIANDLSLRAEIVLTDDNGVGWTSIAYSAVSVLSGGEGNISCLTLLKIEDVANDKIKFKQNTSQGSGYFFGSTDINYTYALFMKLADL